MTTSYVKEKLNVSYETLFATGIHAGMQGLTRSVYDIDVSGEDSNLKDISDPNDPSIINDFGTDPMKFIADWDEAQPTISLDLNGGGTKVNGTKKGAGDNDTK